MLEFSLSIDISVIRIGVCRLGTIVSIAKNRRTVRISKDREYFQGQLLTQCHNTLSHHHNIPHRCRAHLSDAKDNVHALKSKSFPLAEQMAVILRLITKNTVVNVEPSLSVYLVSPIALFLLTSILPKVRFCDGFIAQRARGCENLDQLKEK